MLVAENVQSILNIGRPLDQFIAAYLEVEQRLLDPNLTEEQKFSPFGSASDQVSWQRNNHWFLFIPLAITSALNLLNVWPTKSHKYWSMHVLIARWLEGVFALFVFPVILSFLIFLGRGSTFASEIVKSAVALEFLTIALLFVGCAFLPVFSSVLDTPSTVRHTQEIWRGLNFSLVGFLVTQLPADDKVMGYYHLFSGVAIILGAVIGVISGHLSIPGAKAADQKTTQDRVLEWFMYALYFSASVLQCLAGASNYASPQNRVLGDYDNTIRGVLVAIWVVLGIQALGACILVCATILGPRRQAKRKADIELGGRR